MGRRVVRPLLTLAASGTLLGAGLGVAGAVTRSPQDEPGAAPAAQEVARDQTRLPALAQVEGNEDPFLSDTENRDAESFEAYGSPQDPFRQLLEPANEDQASTDGRDGADTTEETGDGGDGPPTPGTPTATPTPTPDTTMPGARPDRDRREEDGLRERRRDRSGGGAGRLGLRERGGDRFDDVRGGRPEDRGRDERGRGNDLPATDGILPDTSGTLPDTVGRPVGRP